MNVHALHAGLPNCSIPTTTHRVSPWAHTFVACLALLLATVECFADTLVGRVVGVTDGDTITVLDEIKVPHKIRLSGIDAPERSQAFGQRAKLKMAELVFGKEVTVVTHKVDKYGRNVGKVLLDGEDANRQMIVAGMAWHYKQYEREQSPGDRLSYAAAELEARKNEAGLWRDAAPVAPWEWRATKRSKR